MKAELVIIADRSGSMSHNNYHIEMQNGINSFIKDQASQKGKCNLTLTQFDSKYEIIHNGIPINEAPEYKLEPRWSTALLDAIGSTIRATMERLKDKKRTVIFLIVTDGGENSSKEFNRSQISQMIAAQEKQGWIFTFLGANQDAISEGGGMGIQMKNSANFTMDNSAAVYGSLSQKVSSVRAGTAKDVDYTVADRTAFVKS